MGNIPTSRSLLEMIKNNTNTRIKEIVSANEKLIKENKEKVDVLKDKLNENYTCIEACSFYNSYNCIDILLDLKANVSDESYFIACKRDNIFILKSLIEKNGIIDSLIEGYSILDISILSCSYRCAYYLYNEKGCLKKETQFYIDSNFRSDFNVESFISCIENKVERSNTPSFYTSIRYKDKIDGKLPDPNESWKSFINRLAKFQLYQPPLVKEETVNPQQKQSLYVKMQSGLLNIEYNKKILNDENKKKEAEMKFIPSESKEKEDETVKNKV